jgi:hypothetical protein
MSIVALVIAPHIHFDRYTPPVNLDDLIKKRQEKPSFKQVNGGDEDLLVVYFE